MKVIMGSTEGTTNANIKQDRANLNTSSYDNHGGGAANYSTSVDKSSVAPLPTPSASIDYEALQANSSFAHLAGGDGSVFQGGDHPSNPSSSEPRAGSSSDFVRMQHQGVGSDTDTCASSLHPGRRHSRDSILSRDSVSDVLGYDQATGNNLAMLSMLQQQQQSLGGVANQDQKLSWNFNNNVASGINNQQHQMNQSMSQLMMNGYMNMNNMSQQLKGGIMNNAMGGAGGWMNNAGNNDSNNTTNDPTAFRNAFGAADNGHEGNRTAPLVIPPKKVKNKHKQTFAQKLFHILSIKECQDIIRWMPNGCAFCIIDSEAMVDKVLPKYFKEAKYTSFTRKLNRWGFKHFTLPTSEPSQEKEVSIYTHEKFLRDNPSLCQQMDGGHRRRTSRHSSSMTSGSSTACGVQDTIPLLGGGGGEGGGGMGGFGGGNQEMPQLHQQQVMMMQQLQHQRMMMQQLQQMQHQQQMRHHSNQGGGSNPMFDMAGGAGGTNSNNFNFVMPNNSSNGNNNPNSMMATMNMNNLDTTSEAALGMRRTSLGFMPYLPASNRRGSGFSMGGFSTMSNDLGNSYNDDSGNGVYGGSQQHRKFSHGGDDNVNNTATLNNAAGGPQDLN